MNILITGGAGYIGTTLIPHLLSGQHDVTVFDSLMFGGDQLIPFFKYKNFHFVKGDIRDSKALAGQVSGKDMIIHLAAIVGYPACRKDPELATTVNVDGTKNLISSLTKDQFVIYASTGSNYGKVDDVCTEDTPLKPLSLYGQTKTLAETMLLELDNTVVYRFATAFGASPRLRLDLLINDFTYKCATQGYLVVYEKEFKRTFIHVGDIAKAIMMAVDKKDLMRGSAYNVGDNRMNYTKEQICDIISAKTGAYIHYATIGEDADKRDYEVSYEKICKFGFSTTITVEQGIDELIRVFKVVNMSNPYINV